MNKKLSLSLKILAGIVGGLLVLLVVAAVLLNTHSVQNKILNVATKQLEQKLQTRVQIDDVSVNVLTQEINLKGLAVDDQQQRKMLELERLSVRLNLRELMARKLMVSEADIEGVRARLYHPKDGPANYQFIIDAFKRDKPAAADSAQQDTAASRKEPFAFDLHHLKLARIDLQYNDHKVSLDEATFAKGLLSDKHDLTVGGLHLTLDNHLPRKNTGKPKRGWFDAGHLDITADFQLAINHIDKDSVNATLTRFAARDSVTGFNVKDLRFTVGATKRSALLTDIVVQQESTVLRFDSASLVLPNKKEGRKFSFQTSLIKGKTLLRDISRPFAPVLKDFTMPLELSVLFSGTDTTLVFRDIEVHTPDQRLKINATGGISQLNKKEEMVIRFHVSKMKAKGTVKQEIIHQFPVKKLMMKQLETLGDITYTGDIRIPRHKEAFKGVLGTAVGNLDFDFMLNEDTKHITGNAETKSLHLGKVLKMEHIGDIGAKAKFDIDIDKVRTARMRKQYGGKLPIGKVSATVYEASYKKIKVKNLLVDIVSNGWQLEGTISQANKGLDWACDFSLTDLDKPSNIKVKPHVKVKLKDVIKKKKSE